MPALVSVPISNIDNTVSDIVHYKINKYANKLRRLLSAAARLGFSAAPTRLQATAALDTPSISAKSPPVMPDRTNATARTLSAGLQWLQGPPAFLSCDASRSLSHW